MYFKIQNFSEYKRQYTAYTIYYVTTPAGSEQNPIITKMIVLQHNPEYLNRVFYQMDFGVKLTKNDYHYHESIQSSELSGFWNCRLGEVNL